ncbi:7,8-didemethyl-8-hydroxy-5-deazariboflavin synthase subunit 1 [Salisediminibacterium beveridgei]|uniref:7,8-didemethyl-8-hydroxy-5-deazariboflavin synthase n=2 Tax=Salisediminibacterium beveridgei TaxID=632773 RepID=A0A1D7QVP7_9BACI|nr:7,8-didemethyl-8-hydroxy-5-deazariboflavin synthase subunit 1 [Salisediminibacterium beveridgei]
MSTITSYWVQKMVHQPLEDLMQEGYNVKKHHFGNSITFSRNVFIPLTNICKDHCTYCTFQRRPGDNGAQIIPEDDILRRVKTAKDAGCTEVLISLGDKSDYFPEVREWLNHRGFRNMLDYVAHVSKRIIEETGLLPHTNAGVMCRHQLAMLKPYNASMGMMLETVSDRLTGPGQVHEHAPDKRPHRRIRMIEEAGKLKIPFTTGLLVGIGETWVERMDTLLEIKRLQETYGHIQEVIIQNFQPKTGMDQLKSNVVSEETMLRLSAIANILFDGTIHIQVPPNLNNNYLSKLIQSGITDWGGVSPVSTDYINPESPWPAIQRLKEVTLQNESHLTERLPVYEDYITPEWIEEPALSAVKELKGRIDHETPKLYT